MGGLCVAEEERATLTVMTGLGDKPSHKFQLAHDTARSDKDSISTTSTEHPSEDHTRFPSPALCPPLATAPVPVITMLLYSFKSPPCGVQGSSILALEPRPPDTTHRTKPTLSFFDHEHLINSPSYGVRVFPSSQILSVTPHSLCPQ